MPTVPSFELAVRPLFRLARLVTGVEWAFVAVIEHEQRSHRPAISSVATGVSFPFRLDDILIGTLCSSAAAQLQLDTIQLEGMRLLADAMGRMLGVERELTDVHAAVEAAEVTAAEAQGITQRQAIYLQQMKHLAHTDELTGLPNRRAFMARWQAALSQVGRGEGAIGLLLIDADRFKSINDSGGHAMGDTVLRAIGASLHHAVQPSDIVARLGGDEFVVLTTQAHPTQLWQLAETIREQFRGAAEVLAVEASLSIGMASSLDCTSEDLLHDADVALYRSKEAGGNCAHLFACEAEHAAGIAA
jgi:diguanylate cyclase (GGDEF)-like protein